MNDTIRCHLCHEQVTYCECVRCLRCGILYPVDEADSLRGDRNTPSCVGCAD